MPSSPTRERRVSRALLGCALALVLSGAALTWPPRDPATAALPRTPLVAPAPVPAAAPPTPATPVRPARADGDVAGRGERVGWRAARPGPPVRLVVPSLGIDAPVVPVVDSGRALVPPADPQVLGWWSRGARPGAVRGSALVTGHTVSTGGGALDDLEDIGLRTHVEVRTRWLRMPYVVRKVRVFSKGRLTTEAARLFDQDVQGRLVLVTCEDWNGREYLSNVVVTAVPLHTRAWLRAHPGRTARLSPSVFPLGG